MQGGEYADLLREVAENEPRQRKVTINFDAAQDGFVERLAAAMEGNNTVELLSFYNGPVKLDHVVQVCECLLCNSNVWSLQFHGCGLGKEAVGPLSVLLQNNTTLTRLDLNDNGALGDSGVAALAPVLPALREVCLCSCGIGDTGAACLADMLRHNSTMRKLDLSSNPMLDDGIISLAEAFTTPEEGSATAAQLHNCTLEWLAVGYGRYGGAALEAVGRMLRSNRSLSWFSLDGRIPKEACGGLLASLEANWFVEHGSLPYPALAKAHVVMRRNRAFQADRRRIRRTLGAWRTAISVNKYQRYLGRKRP